MGSIAAPRQVRGSTKRTTRSCRRRFATRRGAATLEAVLAVPVCLIVTLAFLQFGPLLIVEATLRTAAEEIARESSKVPGFSTADPGDAQVVERVANEVLGIHGRSLGDPGILVIVEDNHGVLCLGDSHLKSLYCPPSSSIGSAGPIKATVIVNLSDTPVPDLLKPFCIELFDRHYAITSLAYREP